MNNQTQGNNLEFGTGGIRGIMGSDSNHINEQTVKRVILGFCRYINSIVSADEKTRAVAIAYDSRHNSHLFAQLAARVFAAHKISVFMFNDVETTPMLSFTIRHLGCIGGVCITASHNPAQYNGIKVYWSDGAQIVPPQDESIIEYIHNVQSYFDIVLPTFMSAVEEGKIIYVNPSLYDAYFDDLLKTIPPRNTGVQQENTDREISLVYTPLHGTGLKPVTTLLKLLKVKDFFIVPEQAQPNGDFPTVKKPNPEEPESLTLAIGYACERNADIVFATDPDSDRLAVCIKDARCARGIYKHQSKGDYVLLNGNQTGALLLNFIICSMKKQATLTSKHKVIKTMVTSNLLDQISHSYGIEIFNTPTGFKWIANLIKEWEASNPNYQFIFGAEESFGYMFSNNVRDKDAIATLGCMIQMARELKAQNKTLCDALFDLFQKFGAWQEDLICLEFDHSALGMAKIKNIMNYFRNTPVHAFSGIPVCQKIDHLTLENPTNENLVSAHLNFLQFILSDGSQISIRPSGTEPKLKIYISVCTKDENIARALQQTHDKMKSLRYELLTQVQ